MDSATQSPPTIKSSRRDSASTVESEKYLPMPIGRWKLNIHGKCPRCNHHHTALTIQVNVSKESTYASHVFCEKCGQKWLALCGRNQTRISLLSAETMEPDPLEKEFRNALTQMVNSATAMTAIASPTAAVLADIPESSRTPSRDRSLRSPGVDTPQIVPGPPSTTAPQPHFSPMSRADTPAQVPQKRPRISRVLIRLKKIKDKIPRVGKIRFKNSKSLVCESATTSKGKGKQDCGPPPQIVTPEEQVTPQDLPTQDDVKEVKETSTAGEAKSNAYLSHDTTNEAMDSLKKFDKDIIRNMTHEERVKWVREQITQFKARRVSKGSPKADSELPMVSNSTQIYHADLQPFPFASYQPPRRHSMEESDLVGVGAHLGSCPPYNASTLTLNNRPLSISDTYVSQLSQADTAVEDLNAPTRSRISYLQHERHRSPSPRPRSSYSQAHLRQQLLQSRAGDRSSFDSVGTTALLRNTTTPGRRGMNRESLASVTSTLWQTGTEPSASQAQLQPPLPTVHNSGIQAASRSTPDLTENAAANEENRRPTD